MKFGQNLKVVGNNVISYTTHVATIDGDNLIVHGRWSKTTSKHITQVANHYGLTKVDGPKPEVEKNDGGMLKTIGMVMAMGSVLMNDDQKETNDFRLRMIKAGLPAGAIHMPEDWDSLPEEEKTKRLDQIQKLFNS